MNPIALNKSRNRIVISTPVGTKDVRIEGDEVVGVWAVTREYTGPKGRMLLEDFITWDKAPESILRFTRNYGPLVWTGRPSHLSDSALPGENQDFRFRTESWLSIQEGLQEIWKDICDAENKSTSFRGFFSGGDGIELQSGKLVFRASNLYLFLVMEIVTGPIERFRVCKKPGCETPYFVARHLKQAYCSPACTEWAQAEFKKKWWEKRGKQWLANKVRKGRVARRKQNDQTRRASVTAPTRRYPKSLP